MISNIPITFKLTFSRKEYHIMSKTLWGKSDDGKDVYRFTLTNSNGITAVVMNYGANLLELYVPDKKEEFKNLTSIKDDFSLTDVEEINKFEFYIDESGIKELENSILLAKEELKSLKVNNLPQLTAGLAYELINSDISASLSFSWNPLDYKGNEKVKELSIEKLANELDEKKTEIELTKIQSINTFSQNEINLELSKKDVEIAKAELEKYETMKKLGTVSEYDYFNKQKDLLDKELEYINLKNQLNLNKKLEVIYGSL